MWDAAGGLEHMDESDRKSETHREAALAAMGLFSRATKGMAVAELFLDAQIGRVKMQGFPVLRCLLPSSL